jgi:hypothetical protein
VGKRSEGVEKMIWYLIFTIFVAVLGAFTFWFRKRERVENQALTTKPNTEDVDEIED